MTFDKRSLSTIYAALYAAIQWEESLAEAYSHMKKDPAYGKALRTAKKYAKLRLRIAKTVAMEKEQAALLNPKSKGWRTGTDRLLSELNARKEAGRASGLTPDENK